MDKIRALSHRATPLNPLLGMLLGMLLGTGEVL